ncbi:MAG: hypothetical protein CR982_03000 [Candidatus Cloacimonadota bacterium]|nr:MAG: hypothetical protein CR982_03000 [Candidatus Cloacimonadota bacterium]PIE82032.1 MAG: hypothetical protein CSA15_00190 [Candidatus Delongbacteria bacterium]
MKILLLTILISIISLNGFTIANNVNHPEIDWKVLETKHIEVVYHDPLRDDAVLTSKIAEETYEAYTKLYDITLDEKVQIFISDMDDIMNGFSMLGEFIVIWVGNNDYPKYFTGKTKWLRRVISHEISHHFLTNAITTWADIFYPARGFFPGTFHEGYAQYFSGEPWGYGRQDAYLRSGVLERDLNEEKALGFHYATGFSMTKYLATFYGEEKMFKLLKYRNEMKLFNFEDAFKEVYGKSFEDFREEWERYIYTYYYGQFYEEGKTLMDSTGYKSVNAQKTITIPWHSISSLKIKGDNALIFGKKNSSQYYYNLVKAKLKRDSLNVDKLEFEDEKEIFRGGGVSSLDISRSGIFVTYVEQLHREYNCIRSVVKLYDSDNDETVEIGKGSNPQVDSKGDVFFVGGEHNSRTIFRSHNMDNIELFPKALDNQYLFLTLSPDEKKIAFVKYDENSEISLNIYNLETNKIEREVAHDEHIKNLYWDENGLFVTYESKSDFKGSLKKYDLASNKFIHFDTPPFNFQFFTIIEGKSDSYKMLTRGLLRRKENKFGTLTVKKIDEEPKLTLDKNYYRKWIEVKPSIDISNRGIDSPIVYESDYSTFKNFRKIVFLPVPLIDGFSLSSSFMDPLGHNIIAFSSYIPYNFDSDDIWIYGSVTNRQFYPNITLDILKYKFLGGFYEDEPYYTRVIDMGLKFDYSPKFDFSFWKLGFMAGIGYTDVEKIDDDFDHDDIIENGSTPYGEAGFSLSYNLPVVNSSIHPVETFKISHTIRGANKDAGSDYSFTNNRSDMFLGFSPTYLWLGTPFLTFTNSTYFEFQNGKYLTQNGIGIDDFKNIPVENILNNRKYFRGYSDKLSGDMIFSNKTEAWLKISDNFGKMFGVRPEIFSFGYLGIGAFYDNGSIWNGNERSEFISNGFEIKSKVNLLILDFIVKLGRAYDEDFNKLDDYIQIEIPMPKLF